MGLSLGAYLSHPVTDKHSSNEENDKIVYGVSSMQGWRETQEDAHNCILDYDSNASLFAVYDGHGGNEVSEYTSQNLPDFIKQNEFYKKGDYENALKDAFVKFDCTLKEPEVVKVLQKLAKYNDYNDEDGSESEDENLGSLKAEAQMPIEEVMAKYVSNSKEDNTLSNSAIVQSSENVSASNLDDSVRCSAVSSNETECSSSKSHVKTCNESDSEVSSSSSSCIVQRKSLSEKYSNNNNGTGNDRVDKKLLDSTSNGSDQKNKSEMSQGDCEKVTLSSESKFLKGKSHPESSCHYEIEKSLGVDSSESLETGVNKVSCNGKTDENQVEEVISSSVENGEVEESKSSGKGKTLIKHNLKTKGKKAEKEKKKDIESSSDKLFQKFVQSDSNEDLSESDSDDATFNGPDAKSDDDDDDEDEEEDEDGENEGEGEEKEEDEHDEEDDDEDDEDEADDEEDSEEYEYENEMGRCFLEPGSDSGCTALVALIKDNKIYVANAGDCRCVVSKNGEAVELSLDHKPENEIELERIEKAGGRVYAGRVNDGLNLSRALGDHVYKRNADLPPEEQMISPLPDIQILDLDSDIEFMVLACDGIWNSMSSKEVVDFVRPRLQSRTGDISGICEEMFDHCLAPDTLCDGTGCDNMTAIIVQFKDSKFLLSKKRRIDDSEAEESSKKQKTEDVSSTDSIASSQPNESFSEKPSNSPDTTQ